MTGPKFGRVTHLLSINSMFYGVFSAPNIPEQKYFPQGVKFQRNYSEGKLLTRDGQSVPFSIDPYFFRVGARSSAPSAAVKTTTLPLEIKALGKSYWWILLAGILGIVIPIIISLIQSSRAPGKSVELLRQQIQGPPLTNYTGFITARFSDSNGLPINEATLGKQLQMTVELGQDEPKEDWAEKIDLRGGEDAREVVFSIVIDSVDFHATPDHTTASVPTKGGAKVAFTLSPSPDAEDSTIFIQLYQKTRLIHVLRPKLRISEVKTSSEHGNIKSSEIAD